MLLRDFEERKLIHPPKFLSDSTHLLVRMGSEAYGVATEKSDVDLYGVCIPPKEMVFPHLDGHIDGFGRQKQKFESWVESHVIDPADGKEYDFAIYGIVKFFALCMENNPNMVDSLFVPQRCVLHSSHIADHIRNNRQLFLHKGSYHKFLGFAHSQLGHIRSKKNHSNPDRAADIVKHGYDCKFGYNLVRLSLECEQILTEHHLNLERNAKILRAIRNGEWTLDYLLSWFEQKKVTLETQYAESTLRHSPDEDAIKKILMECLEMEYGDLSALAVRTEVPAELIIRDIKAVIERYT